MHWLTTLFQTIGKPFQWWTVVAIWENGIRIRLGKTATMLNPGIHLRIPFLDRVYVQSIRCRTFIDMNQTATTLDGKTITFSLATDFKINDMKQFFNSLSSPESTIGSRAVAVATQFIATNNMSNVTPSTVSKAATIGVLSENWGLEISCRVTTFCQAKTFRLLSADYRTTSGLSHFETTDSGKR